MPVGITKKQGFTFSLENTFLKKPQIDPAAFLGLRSIGTKYSRKDQVKFVEDNSLSKI